MQLFCATQRTTPRAAQWTQPYSSHRAKTRTIFWAYFRTAPVTLTHMPSDDPTNQRDVVALERIPHVLPLMAKQAKIWETKHSVANADFSSAGELGRLAHRRATLHCLLF